MDDNLFVLFAAAEVLARSKSEDAQYKLQAANQYFNKLKGNSMKSSMIIMGGGLPTERQWFLRGAMILPSDRVGN